MIHKGVFFGLATVDIIYYVPNYPVRNEKMKAERQFSLAGGPAANAAVAFAAMDNHCTLITGLGNHPLTQIVKHDLKAHNVQLVDCSDQLNRPPVLSAVTVDLSCGERSIVYSNTDLRWLKKEMLKESLLEEADILMLDGYYVEDAVQVANMARKKAIPVVLDGGSWKENLETLLPMVDYAVCSDHFIPPGCSDKESVRAFLESHGVGNVAITRGEETILVWTQGQRQELPVMQIKPLDTLGAGDIFHGAFCHYILAHDFVYSLSRASEVASLSCASLGTRAWIEQEKFE